MTIPQGSEPWQLSLSSKLWDTWILLCPELCVLFLELWDSLSHALFRAVRCLSHALPRIMGRLNHVLFSALRLLLPSTMHQIESTFHVSQIRPSVCVKVQHRSTLWSCIKLQPHACAKHPSLQVHLKSGCSTPYVYRLYGTFFVYKRYREVSLHARFQVYSVHLDLHPPWISIRSWKPYIDTNSKFMHFRVPRHHGIMRALPRSSLNPAFRFFLCLGSGCTLGQMLYCAQDLVIQPKGIPFRKCMCNSAYIISPLATASHTKSNKSIFALLSWFYDSCHQARNLHLKLMHCVFGDLTVMISTNIFISLCYIRSSVGTDQTS